MGERAELSRGSPAPPLPDGVTSRVTVVIPCYNQAHYLAECIGSLQAQTLEDWEAVVVDDASPDAAEVPRALERIGEPRVRFVRHDRNRGLGASRNTGFRESVTELVYPLDADDRLHPTGLETLVGVLEGDPDLHCAFGDVQLFGRSEGTLEFPGPEPGGRVVKVEDTIPGAGTMTRKSFWEEVGGYDENDVLRHGREDLEFWIRAFQKGCRHRRVPELLYEYRITHASMSVACRVHDFEVREYIYAKHRALFDDAGEGQRFLSTGYHQAALAASRQGKRGLALRLAWKSFRAAPSLKQAHNLGWSVLTAEEARRLWRGEVRRAIPFLGYPLKGEARHRPFFVIGVARSGNTLFRRILTSHSKLHIPPETFVLGQCHDKFRRYGRHLTWPDLVSLVLAQLEFHPEFDTFETRLGPLVERLSDVPPKERNLARLIDGFFRFHAAEQGKEPLRWGDKTPLNSLDDALAQGAPADPKSRGVPQTLEKLLRVFPDAQFLHVYRDGCDVAHSFLSGGFSRDAKEAATRWLHTIRQTRAFAERHADRTLEVRYEDLVGDPEPTVKAVCAFLGVEFEPGMLASDSAAPALGDVPAWFWHEQVGEPINARNPGKGRRNLARRERAEVQAVIGAELASLGYAPATEDLPTDETPTKT